ncbi:gamma-glutamyltransferase family protein [Xanthobacter sp. VTT E-85241]|uniref:gamma-glutamyltransferase family protein n=1 Tax=Roseixanthobacter finlandensis TaxID=3119922 RepID=UPI003728B82E
MSYGPDAGEPPFTTRPEIVGTFGVVASTHWLGTAAGMRILERGGNAFDAAVAVGFALQVVEPHLNGFGGEVPVIFFDAKSNKTQVLCGQGTAPADATIQRFSNLGLDIVPGSGFLSACVPGSFGAWMTLLRDYGTMGVADVLETAIEYARNGYVMLPRIVAAIEMIEPLFRTEWTSSADIYLRNGIPRAGELFTNPDLANTYERIVQAAENAAGSREHRIEAARKAFYEGFVAEAIDKFVRTEAMDTSGRRHAGLLTGQDMANWQPTYEAPLSLKYGNFEVMKAGPWTQGPVFLQLLSLLKGFDLSQMNPVGADFVHVVTECMKLAYADREKFYGDPTFVDVPIERLLSDEYANERRRLIGDAASIAFRPGNIAGYDHEVPYNIGRTEGGVSALGAGEPTVGPKGSVRGDTVHIDVADRFGNIVSATPSGGWLQSSPTVPGLGFALGTRAQMFWLKPGLPSSLAPKKRPRTTLSVTLVYRDGDPYGSFGTPGGDQQDQWSSAFFLRHANHGMNLQNAIDAPMFHNDHMPSSFFPRQAIPGSLTIEASFAQDVQADLIRRGHRLTTVPEWSLGRLSAVSRTGHILRAAANPRYMQGYAFGR